MADAADISGPVPASSQADDVATLSTNLTTASLLSIAELQEAVITQGRAILSFRIEGLICAVGQERRLIALQDDSATVLLELPPLDSNIRAGHRLLVEGKNCAVTRGRFGLQLGTAPAVDADGRHPPSTKSGSVYLEAGMQPLRVEWFNGFSGGGLTVDYEGPGVSRQRIPTTALWRRGAGDASPEFFQPGLEYAAYIGEAWLALPDFVKLQPVATGVAPDFDINLRARPEQSGLLFTGYLQISHAGIYTFHDTTDDGSRLFVGAPEASCRVVALESEPQSPVTKNLSQALSSQSNDRWVVAEGKVTFVSQNHERMELELIERGVPVLVTVVAGTGLNAARLLHQRVRVWGVCQIARLSDQDRTARLVVAGGDQVEIIGLTKVLKQGDVLTTAEQIRRLQPAEARKPYRTKIRGVVTMMTPESLVLQDATGGVFISHVAAQSANQPRPGELWEIEGDTTPGDFSPTIRADRTLCLGSAALPEPIRPIWEQLMNGSLDAEQVEIQGIVTAESNTELVLLTRDGKIKINNHEYYPLPQLRMAAAERAVLLGSVVRVRGVFTANWDWTTGLVKAGEFYLGNVMLSVEEAAPSDPFSGPTLRATDLLLFSSHASAFKRVKVTGQIIYALPQEYLLFDGSSGLRFFPPEKLQLQPGDQIEAVGFPRLGGPSPVLLEGQVRKTGTASLPLPVSVSIEELPASRYDATRVRVEALLLSDTVQQAERVLELQAGPHVFVARLKNFPRDGKVLVRGSHLQLTGVYASAREDRRAGSLNPFELLLNNPGDILVLQQGPWWTVRHTIAVIAALSGGLVFALVWVRMLRRTVAQRTAQLQTEIEERQRVEQRRLMEQERTRVAQDLHDELGAGLTEVGILGSLAKNPAVSPDKKEGYLTQLTALSHMLVTGLDEIVWAVNPRYDSVADLAGYYSLFAQRFLNLAGITCRLQIAESIPEHPLDSRLRHGIFLAFKEALNNVVRHSRATEVQLAIGVAAGDLNISVADNGCGFELAGETPGNDGIAGMKHRMQKLGGDLRISSQPGSGTTVEFCLPLERKQS